MLTGTLCGVLVVSLIAVGGRFATLIVFEDETVLHVFVKLYDIMLVPDAKPVTTPNELTVATRGFELDQVPFKVVSVKVMVRFANTILSPFIGPTTGFLFIVKLFVTAVVPQVVVTEYEMTTTPALTAVTKPALLTVATAILLLLQTPPGVGAVKLVFVFTQKDSAPLRGETTGGPSLTIGIV
jgi:hypothetical protein